MQHDGVRVPRPLQDAASWLGCFDVVQLNEDEMRQLSPDPLSLAVDAIGAGTSLLIVTLAAKGAADVAAPGVDGFGEPAGARDGAAAPLRTALIPAPAVDALDPTGCGDVFGAAAAARLFAGDTVEEAIRHANAMAARNAAFRGAGGLSRHLRGELVTP
jgi:sugar/nucleoside kinase (ribokinase family)